MRGLKVIYSYGLRVLPIALLAVIMPLLIAALPITPPMAAHVEWPTLGLVELPHRFETVTAIAYPDDRTHRLFVLEQAGRIQVLVNGQVQPYPFLDIVPLVGSGGELGLLGMAFSPNFAQNGTFYISYTNPDTDNVLARYRTLPGDPTRADPASAQVLLTIDQPHTGIHRGGRILFGPDGMLYAGIGDGSQTGNASRAQDITVLLGKLLRIDVETGDPLTYTIPIDNPYVDFDFARPEIWQSGLRNPWGFSFDEQTGDLYIGDVGASRVEEINFSAAGQGRDINWGWSCYEGTIRHSGVGCGPPDLYAMPIWSYTHNEGCAVLGGYVYRPPTAPTAEGVYIYSDVCGGKVWGLQPSAQGWVNAPLMQINPNPYFFNMGQDSYGNLYLIASTGTLYRIQSPMPPGRYLYLPQVGIKSPS